eukprot:CAMPEP_0173414672 /NCGR_PEP_ID=MMETSP1356-20130122/84452_1 /TAXON_ID=77927 ORGANISM="Hemiselmis virescens, Strain PCC157" /NCGR_SAMPLE_ID=MMETSP1356 /ASSEMBLY_ACC=CAM_ASM_000847 /LENGTH=268 /DNA_ID=CAMNT_0014376871 /DNA_START=173 /DNA_END=976 /DNA_ORIENTATION=-
MATLLQIVTACCLVLHASGQNLVVNGNAEQIPFADYGWTHDSAGSSEANTPGASSYTPPAAYSRNLVVNGDAEKIPLNEFGWTHDSAGSSWLIWTTCTIQGGRSFAAGSQPGEAPAEMYQDVDVSSYASEIAQLRQQFSFSVAVRRHDNRPWGRLIVEYRSEGETVLEQYDTGFLNLIPYDCGSSTTISDTRFAPNGTSVIRIRLLVQLNGDTSGEFKFDNVRLEANTPGASSYTPPAAYSRNLVVNGDAEKIPLNEFGWTHDSAGSS